MPYACKVCADLRRAEIDLALAAPDANRAAIARTFGLNRNTLAAHAKAHLPAHLREVRRLYGASVDLPALGELHGEYLRLYGAALDALAQAEAGTLRTLSDGSTQHDAPSVTSRVRAIRESRAILDSIVRLAGDAADETERPMGLAQGEMTARVLAQVERLNAKRVDPPHDAHAESYELHGDAEEGDLPAGRPGGTTAAGAGPTPGGVSTGTAPSSPPPMSLDRDMAFPNTRALSEATARMVELDARSTQLDQEDDEVILRLPNPAYTGSAAASYEERIAAGFEDIELTADDLRSIPGLAELIAEHRLNLSSDPRVDDAAQ